MTKTIVMKFKTFLFSLALTSFSLSFTSCSSDEPDGPDRFDDDVDGLFVVCEGQWGYGNASLSFIDTEDFGVQNSIFAKANGQKLGDNAVSATLYDDNLWVVVADSGVIFVIDEDTYIEKNRIENLVSPRYLLFVNDEKAYLTSMYSSEVLIVNPKTFSVAGRIPIESGGETMVKDDRYVYVSCWSYGHSIVKIDSKTDKVVGTLNVGVQPKDMVVDKNGDLWALCDGGQWEGNPAGYEAPTLVRVDLDSFEIADTFTFNLGDNPSGLSLSSEGNLLYWLNNGVYSMSVNAQSLPVEPLFVREGITFYSLTVNPENGDIYFSDAVDYQQSGYVYRYSSTGSFLGRYMVGVIPSGFCWKD